MEVQQFQSYALIFKASQNVDDTEEDSYVTELRNINIPSRTIPVLSFEFVNLEKLLERILSFDDISGIVFSSPRSVEAVHKSVALSHNDDWWPKARLQLKNHHIFAVGEATSKKVDELLGLQSMGHESGNAEALVNVITKVVLSSSKPLLFPAGNLRSDTILTRLTDVGINVDCLTVYETKQHKQLEENIHKLITDKGFPEYILYFSPSGIKFTLPFLEKFHFPLENIKFVAIGPSTKDALKKIGLNPFCMASQPNAKAMISAMLNSGIVSSSSSSSS